MNLFAETSLLKWIVGIDSQHAGTPKLQWLNLPESWGVFVLLGFVAALVFGVFWLYRREINTCPKPVKMVMAAIRLAVLLLLLALFLKPSVFYQQVNEIKPAIAVLRDRSMSFDRKDEFTDASIRERLAKVTGVSADELSAGTVGRAELVNRAFANNPALLEQLRKKGAIRVIDFGTDTHNSGLIPALATTQDEEQEPEN